MCGFRFHLSFVIFIYFFFVQKYVLSKQPIPPQQSLVPLYLHSVTPSPPTSPPTPRPPAPLQVASILRFPSIQHFSERVLSFAIAKM